MSKQSLGRVSLVPKGAYNALTAYERLDVVTHDGASYIVLRPVQGVTPVDGEDYMLLVQDGDTPDLSVGTVETLAAGSKATASIGGTPDKPELNFGIPKGDTGAAPVLKMGKVTTLEAGSEATASLSGTAEEPELNLNIPRGASGGVDVASAEVGQTIIVKAVDADGKPTEWEAADMASGENWRLLRTVSFPEDPSTDESGVEWRVDDSGLINACRIATDSNGNAFSCRKLFIRFAVGCSDEASTKSLFVKVNGNSATMSDFSNIAINYAVKNDYTTGCIYLETLPGANVSRAEWTASNATGWGGSGALSADTPGYGGGFRGRENFDADSFTSVAFGVDTGYGFRVNSNFGFKIWGCDA